MIDSPANPSRKLNAFEEHLLEERLAKLASSETDDPRKVEWSYTRLANAMTDPATRDSVAALFRRIYEAADDTQKVQHFASFISLTAMTIAVGKREDVSPDFTSFLDELAMADDTNLEAVEAIISELSATGESAVDSV